MNDLLAKRFENLAIQAEAVLDGKFLMTQGISQGDFNITQPAFMGWTQKVQHLLNQVAGPRSQYAEAFEKAIAPETWATHLERFNKGKAIFEAAREDFEFGMFRSLRNIVQAEVFTSELEQAAELLDAGYTAAAAVAAGIVLETTIRQLCDGNSIVNDRRSKLDKMNADLAKAGVYNLLVQKRVTHLADLRNNAAHGNQSAYSEADVRAMIPDVERFVAEHLP